MSEQYWLSYGGGVNSTALAVLLVNGRFHEFENWRIVFSDTGEEKPETYDYIRDVFEPWLKRNGKTLEVVRPAESVLERWERLRVTGSRLLRGCTVEGKIRPIKNHIKAHGGGIQLIGIDAGESHRMPDAVRPLVDADIDRDGCEEIIRGAGLPSPGKSGCWCCPFMRVGEIIRLAKHEPCKFERIARLERVATETHGVQPNGEARNHWGGGPAEYWRMRASQGDFFDALSGDEMPCGCFDG
jgi:hypothetical protein